MFTGIVEGIGEVEKIEKQEKTLKIDVRAPFSLSKEKTGDSIAINGCCLTITSIRKNSFSADLSPETVQCTTFKYLKQRAKVNLERALRFSDRLGGHLVQGHVDGVACLVQKKEIKDQSKNYLFLEFEIPKNLKKYLIKKGSITIDGVSLTLNEIKGDRFSVCLIPHTQIKTTLPDKKVGDSFNIEVDLIAKYLENFINSRK